MAMWYNSGTNCRAETREKEDSHSTAPLASSTSFADNVALHFWCGHGEALGTFAHPQPLHSVFTECRSALANLLANNKDFVALICLNVDPQEKCHSFSFSTCIRGRMCWKLLNDDGNKSQSTGMPRNGPLQIEGQRWEEEGGCHSRSYWLVSLQNKALALFHNSTTLLPPQKLNAHPLEAIVPRPRTATGGKFWGTTTIMLTCSHVGGAILARDA
ncbi:hypothetical protein BU15DRAFT_65560 [Melanogaster broomeanus]|nr:hypothetical protein BU15DRAFT_65560 [Melanogaster broomeanus]